MDVLNLKIDNTQREGYEVLNFYINNKNLIDILREFETQFDEKIAGEYDGILLGYYDNINIVDHFMGRTQDKTSLNYWGKIQLLGCTCFEPSCWPFLTDIIVNEDSVIWTGFQQPFRSNGSRAGTWDYSGLGIFEFNRAQYEEEIARTAKQIAPGG